MINNPLTFNPLINKFFDQNFTGIIETQFLSNGPCVNIVNEEKSYCIEVLAPGLQKSDFKIEITKDQLIISAKVDPKTKAAEIISQKNEFNYGVFSRKFYLSPDIDRSKIDAQYQNGILNIQLVKLEVTKPESRKIKIS